MPNRSANNPGKKQRARAKLSSQTQPVQTQGPYRVNKKKSKKKSGYRPHTAVSSPTLPPPPTLPSSRSPSPEDSPPDEEMDIIISYPSPLPPLSPPPQPFTIFEDDKENCAPPPGSSSPNTSRPPLREFYILCLPELSSETTQQTPPLGTAPTPELQRPPA
jgi:hypothetical protein